jgi:hypothetical protein
MRRRTLRYAAIGLLAGPVAALMAALPANATNYGENCNTASHASGGTFCYFYHNNFTGAEEGLINSDPNLTVNNAIYFRYDNVLGATTDLSGKLIAANYGINSGVWNDAGSGLNVDTTCAVTIYEGANYTGTNHKFAALAGDPGYLSVWNNNYSQKVCT